MNKMIELNESEKYLRVQPGMILKDLQDYVGGINYFIHQIRRRETASSVLQ